MTTSFKAMGVLSLLALSITASAVHAQGPRLALEAADATHLADLGSGNSVFYTRPQPQAGSTLVTRPANAVLCSYETELNGSVPGVTVDPNGYLPPFLVGTRAPDPLLDIASFPVDAQFRTAQRLDFGDMLFAVEPNFVVVGDVEGYCVAGLAQANPAPATSGCDVQPDSYFADRISDRSFEAGGQVDLYSRIIDQTPSSIYYEHVIRASGGAVSGVQLREQFPYRSSASTGPSRFKSSLGIDSSWVCRASQGAQCSSKGTNDAGLGYANLTSASLDDGACLRVVSMRPIDGAGIEDSDFSGTIHAALFHARSNVTGGVFSDISQTRLNFD